MAQKRSILSPIPLFYGLRVKLGIVILLITVGVIIGNWLAFQHARALLFRDVEQRGIWGARNLAHDARHAISMAETQDLRDRVNALLLQDDVVYVGVADRKGALLMSSGSPFTQQAGLLPELPNHSCQTTDPIVSSGMIFKKQALIISVPIVPIASMHADDSAAIAGQCSGTLHIGMSLSVVDQRLFQMLVTLVALSGYVIGIGALAYSLAKRQVLRPLSHIIAVAQRLAQGDFREPEEATPTQSAAKTRHNDVPGGREEVHSLDDVQENQDEIGLIARTLAEFLGLARARIVHLKNTGLQVSMASDENAIMANEALTASQQHAATCSQAAASLETSTDMFDTIAANAARIASTADSSMEAAHNIAHMVAQTLSAMQELSQHTNRNSERIGQLGETFSQIGSVMDMINTIADQTRMIAFNASIEAAGAGESGGRFSIVATEVRRLANTVVESLDEIQELVSSIQAATSELTLSSETSARKAEQGMTLIGETGTTVRGMLDMLETTARIAQHITVETRQYQDVHHAVLKEMAGVVEGSRNSAVIGAQALDSAGHMQQFASEFEDALQAIRV